MSIANFVKDTTTKEEVFEYIFKRLDEHALKLLYEGKEAKEVKLAREALLKAKSKMELEFGEKPTPKVHNRAV